MTTPLKPCPDKLTKRRTCLICQKQFATIRARQSHQRDKHTPKSEPSYGSRLADAYVLRSMGCDVDEDLLFCM